MEAIYPITAEGCTPHLGRTVCAVMSNGAYFVGRMCNITAEGIYLDGGFQGTGAVTTLDAKQTKNEIKQNLQTVKTKAFFNPFFFPFASLAFLFALPFFFSPFLI